MKTSLIISFLVLLSGNAHADTEKTFLQRSEEQVRGVLDSFSSKWVDNARGLRTPEPPIKDARKLPQGGAAGGPPPESGAARTLDSWLPMCFLISPDESEQIANQNIKAIVDSYASCGIAVEAFPFTVAPGFPQDFEQLNQRARQACDFGRAFVARGAIQVMSGNSQIPEDMCTEPGASGCSTLCERLSVSQLAKGAGPDVALHESLHSNCCERLCVNEGEGTGTTFNRIQLALYAKDFPLFHAEPGGRATNNAGARIPQDICATLQSGASPNDGTHRTDPNKLTYYVAAKDPEAYKQLNGTSFFTAKPATPPIAKHPAGAGEDKRRKRLGKGKAPEQKIEAKKAKEKDSVTDSLLEIAGSKHQKAPLDAATQEFLRTAKEGQMAPPAENMQYTTSIGSSPSDKSLDVNGKVTIDESLKGSSYTGEGGRGALRSRDLSSLQRKSQVQESSDGVRSLRSAPDPNVAPSN